MPFDYCVSCVTVRRVIYNLPRKEIPISCLTLLPSDDLQIGSFPKATDDIVGLKRKFILANDGICQWHSICWKNYTLCYEINIYQQTLRSTVIYNWLVVIINIVNIDAIIKLRKTDFRLNSALWPRFALFNAFNDLCYYVMHKNSV